MKAVVVEVLKIDQLGIRTICQAFKESSAKVFVVEFQLNIFEQATYIIRLNAWIDFENCSVEKLGENIGIEIPALPFQ